MECTFDNNIPIYIQLLEYMKIYLISGVFKCGEKLPSVREFATTFKVNPNTMQKALAELESMNLIYTERTNGKYVTTAMAGILGAAAVFGYNLDLIYALGIVGNISIVGKIVTVFAFMCGSSAISEIIARIKVE